MMELISMFIAGTLFLFSTALLLIICVGLWALLFVGIVCGLRELVKLAARGLKIADTRYRLWRRRAA